MRRAAGMSRRLYVYKSTTDNGGAPCIKRGLLSHGSTWTRSTHRPSRGGRNGGRRHLGNKALVAVAAQVDGKGIGRIRLRRIPDASSRTLLAFVKSAVEPGSVVITDGWEGYDGLKNEGYPHRPRVISGSGKTASMLLPRVHRVASLLKRWLLGTHQGAVSLSANLDSSGLNYSL
jgi:transposase-like protein